MHHRTLTALASALLLLTACGGGGSDGLRVETSYNAGSAWQNQLTTAQSYSATGRGSDGRDYNYSLQFTPQGASAYPRTGAAATRVNKQGVLSAPGLSPVVDIGALFFIGSFLLIGLTSGAGCSDVSMPFAPTGLALPGSGAGLFSSTGYPDCAQGTASDGTGSTASWSIQIYSGDVYFCQDITQRNSGGAVAFTQSTCLQISPNGGLGPKIQYTLVIPAQNFSLVARGG